MKGAVLPGSGYTPAPTSGRFNPQQGNSKFQSAQEVGEAYKNGDITINEGIGVLRRFFGFTSSAAARDFLESFKPPIIDNGGNGESGNGIIDESQENDDSPPEMDDDFRFFIIGAGVFLIYLLPMLSKK